MDMPQINQFRSRKKAKTPLSPLETYGSKYIQKTRNEEGVCLLH
jgi:hypothetical protein